MNAQLKNADAKVIENYGAVKADVFSEVLVMLAIANTLPMVRMLHQTQQAGEGRLAPALCDDLTLLYLKQVKTATLEHVSDTPTRLESNTERLNHDKAAVWSVVLDDLMILLASGKTTEDLVTVLELQLELCKGEIGPLSDVDWNIQIIGGQIPQFDLVVNGRQIELVLLLP